MINSIDEILLNVKNIGITGHVRPDGDCVGSTLGLYNYISRSLKSAFLLLMAAIKYCMIVTMIKNMMFLLY